MANAAADLFFRLSEALGGHDVHPAQRQRIQQAWAAAGGDQATWKDLPPDIQREIEQIEKQDPTSWDDPADVPGNE